MLLERHAGQTVKNSYRQDGLVQNTCGAMSSRRPCYVIVGIFELRAQSLLRRAGAGKSVQSVHLQVGVNLRMRRCKTTNVAMDKSTGLNLVYESVCAECVAEKT